jgi:nicotinate phosphoribosyltransferase
MAAAAAGSMSLLGTLYGHSLGLCTDLYQLTMAQAYWQSGLAERRAVFHLFFRNNPFGGGYAVACGLGQAVELLDSVSFTAEDCGYLAGLEGEDGQPLFAPAFLEYLQALSWSCDVDAIPEGTVVFPREPLVRVRGPVLQAQLLETPLLNLVNFQTLIATKAARVCLAAAPDPVLEFGLRRAQGIDGGLSAARAAFVGGCAATSNVLAGKLLGIPVKGTHAHSWVMAFDEELDAFEAYARAMPNNCVFLVDTYDTLDGVRNAVEAGRRLRARGHEMLGVRLDSGDLAYLSIEARRILDEGGFPQARIFASNDLDEHLIQSLKLQGARITVWGVGTKLVTGGDDPALGGVYKLSALEDDHGRLQPKVKLSEQAAKVSNPGVQQVRRFREGGEFIGDVIYDEMIGIGPSPTIVDPLDMSRRKTLPAQAQTEELLVPIFRRGERVYEVPGIASAQRRTGQQLASFHAGIKRFSYPHEYPVGLEEHYFDLKTRIVLEARGLAESV